jgi:hypothetical protein
MELLLRNVYVAELEGDEFTDAEAGPKREKESAQSRETGAPQTNFIACVSVREKRCTKIRSSSMSVRF